MTRKTMVYTLREIGEWLLCFACLYLAIAMILAIAEIAQ